LYVDAVVVSGGNVFMGGSFATAGGRQRSNLAVVDTVAGRATTWDPYTDYPVHALALSGPTLYVGGDFSFFGGQPCGGLAALDVTSGLLRPWTVNVRPFPPVPYSGVIALAATGMTMFAGGAFLGANDFARSYLVGTTAAVTAVEDLSAGRAAEPLSASPNPFRSAVALRLASTEPAQVLVEICDVAGRRVRRLHGSSGGGRQEIMWDGRSDGGDSASPGVYLVRAQVGARELWTKVLRLR
jgi:hypothetical protein